MPIGLLFWFLFIVYILFGGWAYFPASAPSNYRPFGGHLLLCILIFLLGWKEFGFIIK